MKVGTLSQVLVFPCTVFYTVTWLNHYYQLHGTSMDFQLTDLVLFKDDFFAAWDWMAMLCSSKLSFIAFLNAPMSPLMIFNLFHWLLSSTDLIMSTFFNLLIVSLSCMFWSGLNCSQDVWSILNSFKSLCTFSLITQKNKVKTQSISPYSIPSHNYCLVSYLSN